MKYRGALSGKGGKWNDKTLDKWLKSPADYAPGKYLKSIRQINIKNEKRVFTEKRHQLLNEILFDIKKWTNILSIFTGNAMAFAGVPNAKDRGDLVAYLKEAKWG